MLTPEQAADRYVTAGSSPAARKKYEEGVNAFQGNPMEMAAAQDEFFLQRVTEAVTSGRRRARLMATPVSLWKNNAITKGAPRLGTGMQAARPKVVAHFQRFGPVYEQVRQTVRAMPKGGLANAQARSAAAIAILMSAAGRS